MRTFWAEAESLSRLIACVPRSVQDTALHHHLVGCQLSNTSLRALGAAQLLGPPTEIGVACVIVLARLSPPTCQFSDALRTPTPARQAHPDFQLLARPAIGKGPKLLNSLKNIRECTSIYTNVHFQTYTNVHFQTKCCSEVTDISLEAR